MNTSPSNLRKYKIRTKAYLVLYTYYDNKLNFIVSKHSDREDFKIPSTEITLEDNVGTFAIVRMMVSEYFGIFSKKSLEKLIKNENLTENEIRKETLKWYNLTEQEDYFEWCETISGENTIQYDDLDEEIVYFVEIAEKLNLENLNKNLTDLGLGLNFAYYNHSEKLNLELNSVNLIKQFDFNSHIQETKSAFQNGDFHYYIILSIKDGNTKDQAGFFHFPSLFQGLYKQNKEKWVLFAAGTLVFPSKEMLDKTKAIIIPGSALNLYNDIPFIPATVDFLKSVHNDYKQVKVLGICFGEQLMCYTFGGKVDKLEAKKKDNRYSVTGPNEVEVNEEFWEIPFVKNSGELKKNKIVIIQAHGDEVVEFPSFMKNYGSSDTCKNEVIVSDDHRYFLIQGHPEYAIEFNIPRFFKFLTGGKITDPEEMEKTKNMLLANMSKLKQDHVWRSLCFSFLKNY